jgi:geranylgeranyl pyrophosphate synthase
MALAPKQQPPLGEHRALVREYLRRIALPFESVAGTIVRERLASEREEELLRPSLVLWACQACGGAARAAVPVAAAIALFERSMRLHDELAEEGALAQWGLGQSLNAGDALYAIAFRTLADDAVKPQRRLAATRIVARAVLEAIEGRNGAMTAAALASGALIAGASENLRRCFARAGRMLAGVTAASDSEGARAMAHRAVSAMHRCGIEAAHCATFEDLVAYQLEQRPQ